MHICSCIIKTIIFVCNYCYSLKDVFTSLAPFGRCFFVYSIDSSIVRSIGLDSPQFEASDNFFLISSMSFCSSFLFSIDELVAGLYELVSLLQPTKNTEATIRNILTTLDFITKPP